MTEHPIYRRSFPKRQNQIQFNFGFIDLEHNHLPPYPTPDPSGTLPDLILLANSLFDARAAAVVSASVGNPSAFKLEHLLQVKNYENAGAGTILIMKPECMAAMAYADYFPDSAHGARLRSLVSEAIGMASPGWCGSFGPGADGALDLLGAIENGDYDMTQMHLLPVIYRYYDELTEDAKERLIRELLARGRVHRLGLDDTLTNGGAPNDWSRAGAASFLQVDIPETENHVLMIATARYLTNQLLYQRTHHPQFDNRRNGSPSSPALRLFDDGRPSCFDQIMMLLQIMLIDDFAEYNAKNYQEQTRSALVNLCSYAYDDEVRLAARMVLDYISAHIAVSSNDLRRFVPFRRLNEGPKSHRISNDPNSPDFGFMDVSLTAFESGGSSDPMAPWFAILTGNTRAFEMPNPAGRNWAWGINPHAEYVQEVFSDYRLPIPIHDLFVNDLHRHFFQRIHRFSRYEPGFQRNCDNMEIYSGSPSYLITAGGRPAWYVIPGFAGLVGYKSNNLGVAVPTSFMPTSLSAGLNRQHNSTDLIQFCQFSDLPLSREHFGGTENYGVAPDFACGYKLRKPNWVKEAEERQGIFTFVDKGSKRFIDGGPGAVRFENGRPELAGFFLAFHEDGDFAVMEAFDTWLHPAVTFEQFKIGVLERNQNLLIENNKAGKYTTQNGNVVTFLIWNVAQTELTEINDSHRAGSKILHIEYASPPADPNDTMIDAGNDTSGYLRGTVLNSPREAVVEITNRFLRDETGVPVITRITLDLSDRSNPKRTIEVNGEETEREEAGKNHEVWVDFRSPVADEAGDFFHPFKTLAAAMNAVAEGGTIKITPGSTTERIVIAKRVKIIAPIGDVTMG